MQPAVAPPPATPATEVIGARATASESGVRLKDMSAPLLVQLMLRQVGRHTGPLQPPSWSTASMAKRLVTLLQSAEVTTAMLEDDIELEFLSAWFEERLGQEQAIFDQALGQGKRVPVGYSTEKYAQNSQDLLLMLAMHAEGFARLVEAYETHRAARVGTEARGSPRRPPPTPPPLEPIGTLSQSIILQHTPVRVRHDTPPSCPT